MAAVPTGVDHSDAETPARPQPLVAPAIALLAGVAASDATGIRSDIAIAAAGVIGAACAAIALLYAPRMAYFHIAVLLVLAAFAGGVARHQSRIAQPPSHIAHALARDPSLTRLRGTVISKPVVDPPQRRNIFLPVEPVATTRFLLRLEEIVATEPAGGGGVLRVNVRGAAHAIGVGDRVELAGWLYAIRGARNPGEPEWARIAYIQGVDAGVSVEGPQYVRRMETAAHGFSQRRERLRSIARSLLFEPYSDFEGSPTTRLLDTMVLGQRSAAGRDLNDAFLRVGGSHFLSVSGFHVGLLGLVAWIAVRTFGGSPRIAAAATVVVVGLYALIAESNPPILRAALVALLVAAAVWQRRPANPLNWLAFAAIVIVTASPLSVLQPGFQLSFLQAVALLTVIPRVYRGVMPPAGDVHTLRALLFHRFLRAVVGLLIVCVLAWLIALPAVLLHFQRFSWWGAIGTAILTPVASASIVLSFLTALANAVWPAVGETIGWLSRVATECVLAVVAAFDGLPGSLVECDAPPVALALTFYIALGLLALRPMRRADEAGRLAVHRDVKSSLIRRIPAGMLVANLIAWCVWLAKPAPRSDAFILHALSVGNGSANVLIDASGDALIVDAGTLANFDVGETVARAVRALRARTIHFVAVSHANLDHFSGVPTLLALFPATRFFVNPYHDRERDEMPVIRRLVASLPPKAPPTERLRAGDELSFGSAHIEVLWPPPDQPHLDPNDRSLVLRIHVFGRSILIPGDVEFDAMRQLFDQHERGEVDLHADVLIAPHHGAVISPTAAFYAAVAPEVVIASTQRPQRRLQPMLDALFGRRCKAFLTRESGAVAVAVLRSGRLEVKTPFLRAPAGRSEENFVGHE